MVLDFNRNRLRRIRRRFAYLILSLDVQTSKLEFKVPESREPSELELGLIKTHLTLKQMLRVKWMRVRCASNSDRGWVVQASAVSAMRLGIGVVSLCGH